MKIQIEKKDNIIRIRFKGPLHISKKTFLELIKDKNEIISLLEEIEKREWKWRLWEADGEGIAEINLDEAIFRFKEYIPDEIMRELRGRRDNFWFEIDLGEKKPRQIEILSVLDAVIEVTIDEDATIRINPFKKTINYISNLFWNGIPKRKARLLDAKKLHNAVQFLLDKGFKFGDKYVAETFQELTQKIMPEYTFSIRLSLTVINVEKVPSWETLVKELYEFFESRGIAARIDEEKSFLRLFEKPIP